MSKKHVVLTGIVLTALSVGVASAAPSYYRIRERRYPRKRFDGWRCSRHIELYL